MDNIENSSESIQNNQNGDLILGISKNSIIVLLLVLVVLALLGFNIFLGVGLLLDKIFAGVKNIFVKILSMLGFYTGAIINTTADVVGDTAKETIDIAEGSVQSIGHLLQNRDNMGSQSIEQNKLDFNMFNLNPTPHTEFEDNDYDNENILQIDKLNQELKDTYSALDIRNKEIKILQDDKQTLDDSINKSHNKHNSTPGVNYNGDVKWCPVGSDGSTSKCISVNGYERCMYGKVFDDEETCVNSIKKDFTKINYNDKSLNWGTSMPPPPPAALGPLKQPLLFNSLPGNNMGYNSCIPSSPCNGPMNQNVNGLMTPPFQQHPIQYPPMHVPPKPPVMSNNQMNNTNPNQLNNQMNDTNPTN